MKVRLAKKIMEQQPQYCKKAIFYWHRHWIEWYDVMHPPVLGKGVKADHRITKAISLTSKKKK